MNYPPKEPGYRVKFEDRRKGALYGQAIGDALGMPYEFDLDPESLTGLARYQPPNFKESGLGFVPGSFTDDTQQALALAWAMLDAGSGDLTLFAQNFAKRMYDWRCATKDVGYTTAMVVGHPDFLTDPLKASEDIWDSFGRDRAANGGVMRAVGGALPIPWSGHDTLQHAAVACKVTHFDPRCVASAVAATKALSWLIGGFPVEEAIERAARQGARISPDSETYIRQTDDGILDLAEEGASGFTYKCLGAGFWALNEFQRRTDERHDDEPYGRFWDILSRVIRAGGDTDTNAALAGALMGAHIGFSNLPLELVEGLRDKDQLDALLEALPPLPRVPGAA